MLYFNVNMKTVNENSIKQLNQTPRNFARSDSERGMTLCVVIFRNEYTCMLVQAITSIEMPKSRF